MSIQSILSEQDQFTDLEKRIANYFITEQININQQTTRQIATSLFTTPSKIVRFCQKIGFSGFSDFKKAYIKELNAKTYHIDYNFPFHPNDKTTQLSKKMGELYHHHIDETLSQISHDTLNKALSLLTKANKIIILSSGTQAGIASSFQERMIKIGVDVQIEQHLDLAYYRASHEDTSTLYLVISYSGQTPATLKIVDQIKQRNIPILAITSNIKHPLSKKADVCLYLSTHETLISNLGHFGTNISTLLLLDILYAQYFNQNFDEYLEKRITVSSSYQTQRHSDNPILKD